MTIPPSELWEMDGDELIFWFEQLRQISETEHEAARAE